LKRLQEEQAWKGKIIGILPTFYDEVTRKVKRPCSTWGNALTLNAQACPSGTILRECVVEGKTIFELRPESRAAREYGELAGKVKAWNRQARSL
jgi:chromosome partitioning protein